MIYHRSRNAGLPIYGNGAVSVLSLDDLAATPASAAFEDRQVSRYNTKGHVVYMPEYAGVTADDSVPVAISLRRSFNQSVANHCS